MKGSHDLFLLFTFNETMRYENFHLVIKRVINFLEIIYDINITTLLISDSKVIDFK